jgi:hypothetical protein
VGRIRTIKPETLDDEVAASLSDTAWRLWVSTWLLADDHGNARASARYLAATVWQDTSRSPRVAEVLRELQKAGLIGLYEHKGQTYLHINGWERHQRIDNAGRPRVPLPKEGIQIDTIRFAETRGEPPQPSEVCRSTSDHDHDHDHRSLSSRSGDSRRADKPPEFDFTACYARYPRKEGKKKGLERLRKSITTPERFELLKVAIENYRAKCESERIEARFIKHFDSFAMVWEDYATVEKSDPQAPAVRRWNGTVIGMAPVEPAPTKTRILKA